MNEPNENEWEAPPPPAQSLTERLDANAPQMSEVATLGNIFFEPGNTFESFRRVPRFILASLIIILSIAAFNAVFIQKLGFEKIVRDSMKNSPNVTEEQMKVGAKMYENPAMQAVGYGAPVIVMFVVILIGGLLYWGGGATFGGSLNFLQGLSIWVYSSFPPTLIAMVLNILVLMFKSVDDIDASQAQRGVLQANLSFLVDGKSQPLFATLLSTIDLFSIFGLILASIGFQKTARLSSGTAWTVVLVFWLITVTFRIAMTLISGNPS